jgi:heme/copper-type cytochrome/quinol oxidase subunit 2
MKVAVTACVVLSLALPAASAFADNQPGTSSAVTAAFQGVTKQHYTVYVLPGGMGETGPDKAHHDMIAPSDFVLRAGVPVTLTIVNFDDGNHTITSPALGLNIMIKAGIDEPDGSIKPVTTTMTFTPKKAGQYRWNCMVMCDGPSHWAMSAGFDGPGQDGFMAGWFIVL